MEQQPPCLWHGGSACQKSLAEFAPAGAKKDKLFFGRDMCVDENTSRPASVEFVGFSRTNSARSGLHPTRKSGKATFSTVSAPVPLARGLF